MEHGFLELIIENYSENLQGFFLVLLFPVVPETRASLSSSSVECSCSLGDTVGSLRKGMMSSVTQSASG